MGACSDDSLLVSSTIQYDQGTYDNVDSLVNVDYAAGRVDNGYGTDSTF